MRARVRDTEIYFDVEGLGLVADGARMRERPIAFVIHGGPGSEHSDLKGSMSPLARQMQLVYFDHRGQGRSARGDPKRYNLDENVEDLEALRQYLGIGPIVSIGTSYGGMVAMAHAARHPASVSHLVLIVTASHAGFIRRAKEIVAERGTPEQRATTEDLWAGRLRTPEELRRYYELMGPLYSRKHDPVRAKASLDRRILSPDALNQAFAPGGFMYAFDLRPELGRIAAPTLIVAGRHDWICPPEFSEEIHAHIPGSELRIFENSSHSVRSDEPERLIETILEFVATSAPR